jgi:hemoglobin/transferrin/lactoferrin receptor protein
MSLPLRSIPQARLLAVAISAVLAGYSSQLFASEAQADSKSLDELVVTSTLTEKKASQVPNSVSKITRDDMDKQQVTDMKDLMRYEPGISTSTSTQFRGGNQGYNIRGITDNRVMMLVDGVPLPERYSGSFFGRDFVDPEGLQSVEIVKGPASSLYGSDAIGGVVSFRTLDPKDLLKGKEDHASIRLGYHGANNEKFGTVRLATGKAGGTQMMAIYSRSAGDEFSNKGDADIKGYKRTKANPASSSAQSLLTKIAFDQDPNSKWLLTFDAFQSNTDIDQQTLLTSPAIQSNIATDERNRYRFSVNNDRKNVLGLDSLALSGYYQTSHSTNKTTIRATTYVENEDSPLNQDSMGISAIGKKKLITGDIQHLVTGGIQASLSTMERITDRERNGSKTFSVRPGAPAQVFPQSVFPRSDMTKVGAFVQDEVAIGNLTIVPGVRFDHYTLSPSSNQNYINAGGDPKAIGKQEGSAVSPRLGLVYSITPGISWFANYAQGYRAPEHAQVNGAFTNRASGYALVANPNLKAESSYGLETGLRFNGSDHSAEVVLFDNHYDDFINSNVSLGTIAGLPTFQAQNVGKAHIYGAEAKGRYLLNNNWTLRGSFAYAHGDNQVNGKPIDSVLPMTTVAGISYRPNSRQWGSELVATMVSAKDRVSDPTYFKTSGFEVFDLLGWYEFSKQTKLNAGIYNLADTKYILWNNVNALNPSSATSYQPDLYSQPGRYVNVTLQHQF